MSLSKIVSNLRSKLKDEEKKNQSLNLKLDQVLKEKDKLKEKITNMEHAQKRGHLPNSREVNSSFAPPYASRSN